MNEMVFFPSSCFHVVYMIFDSADKSKFEIKWPICMTGYSQNSSTSLNTVPRCVLCPELFWEGVDLMRKWCCFLLVGFSTRFQLQSEIHKCKCVCRPCPDIFFFFFFFWNTTLNCCSVCHGMSKCLSLRNFVFVFQSSQLGIFTKIATQRGERTCRFRTKCTQMHPIGMIDLLGAWQEKHF